MKIQLGQDRLERLRAARLRDLAAFRHKHETGGFTLTFQGETRHVPTDRDSVSALNAIVLAAGRRPNYRARFKMKDGARVELTRALVEALADAVRDFVQACFDREEEHETALLASASIEELLHYDVAAGWPGNPAAPP